MQTFTIPLFLAILLIKISYSWKQFFSQFILGQVSLYTGNLNYSQKVKFKQFLFLEEQKTYFKTNMQIPRVMDMSKI